MLEITSIGRNVEICVFAISFPPAKIIFLFTDQKAQCSVCWEDFKLDEMVNQLQCEHIFHNECITPWLELHATCPVCRKPQNEAAAAHSRQVRSIILLNILP